MRAPFLSATLAGLLVLTSCSKEQSGQTLIVNFGNSDGTAEVVSGNASSIPLSVNYKGLSENKLIYHVSREDISVISPGSEAVSLSYSGPSAGELSSPYVTSIPATMTFSPATTGAIYKVRLKATVSEATGKISASDTVDVIVYSKLSG